MIARFWIATILLAGCAMAQKATVIRNATVYTITKGTFQGDVVIREGRIVDAGQSVMTPAGAEIIDAVGKHVIPGIIDTHSHIALDSVNEGSISVSSMTRCSDVINAESIAIYRALAGGVTTANLLHGSANAIGGNNVVVKMRWGKDALGLIMKEAKPSLKMALGENPKRQGQGGQSPFGGTALRYPGTRMGVEDVIRDAFNRARLYQVSWKDYEAKRSRGEPALPPRRDLAMEPLVEVLEGKRLVHAHAYRADEILMLIRLADEYGFKIRTFDHVLEGYKVAKEIAAHGAGASILSDWWAYKVEAYDAIPYNAAILTKRGVSVSMHSDDVGDAEQMRRLNTEAAKAVKYGGVSEDEALAMITINAARQLDIDQWVGSIETGKQADLVFYDKHPLSIFAKVEKVLIDGEVYFDRDKDLAERPKKAALKQGLIQKEAESEKRSAPQARRPS